MNKDYTIRTVPFRILHPTLKMLSTAVAAALTQVYTKEWEHQQTAGKIIVLRDKTLALENQTRNTVLTHLVSWYGLALELSACIESTHPQLAGMLKGTTQNLQWLDSMWEFMKERMAG